MDSLLETALATHGRHVVSVTTPTIVVTSSRRHARSANPHR
jgi:hypothetical protein